MEAEENGRLGIDINGARKVEVVNPHRLLVALVKLRETSMADGMSEQISLLDVAFQSKVRCSFS